MKARAHIYVSGRVQGVFFRARTMERAVRLGVTGWVRNLPDKRVEAVFEGEEESVKAIVEFCKRGSRGAVVAGLDLRWEPVTGEFADFRIRHTNSF